MKTRQSWPTRRLGPQSVPFFAARFKAIGVPLAKLAAKVMTGKKLAELEFTEEIIPTHFSVKEAVFPFLRYQGTDIALGPEMKSTGEVIGLDTDYALVRHNCHDPPRVWSTSRTRFCR